MIAGAFPFEQSMPSVVSAAVGAIVCGLMWVGTQARGWLIAGGLAAMLALGIMACDRFVVTQREEIEERLMELARAAERHDVTAILSAIDESLEPVRDEAERAIRLARPREVRLTSLEIERLDDARGAQLPTSAVRIIVRVTADGPSPERPILIRLRLELERRASGWKITSASTVS